MGSKKRRRGQCAAAADEFFSYWRFQNNPDSVEMLAPRLECNE